MKFMTQEVNRLIQVDSVFKIINKGILQRSYPIPETGPTSQVKVLELPHRLEAGALFPGYDDYITNKTG